MNFEVHIDETSGFFLEFWLKFLAENLSLIESPSPAPNGPEVEGPRKSSVKQLRLEITSRFQAQVRSELENLSLTTTDAKKKPQKRKWAGSNKGRDPVVLTRFYLLLAMLRWTPSDGDMKGIDVIHDVDVFCIAAPPVERNIQS